MEDAQVRQLIDAKYESIASCVRKLSQNVGAYNPERCEKQDSRLSTLEGKMFVVLGGIGVLNLLTLIVVFFGRNS